MVEPDIKVAVVTGGNRGLGLAIVKQLCKTFDGHVYLTARDASKGKVAVENLRLEGLNCIFHPLDITDITSIRSLRQYLAARYGGIDILINNAGIASKEKQSINSLALKICGTNFTGTVDVCKALIPLLRTCARVVNVSSVSGKIGLHYFSKSLKDSLQDDALTIEGLVDFMQSYIKSAEMNMQKLHGWRISPYGVSKVFLTIATKIFQRDQNSRGARGILINACSPSLVATEMTNFKGQPTEKGCRLPLLLATIPAECTVPQGQFIHEDNIRLFPEILREKRKKCQKQKLTLASYQPILVTKFA